MIYNGLIEIQTWNFLHLLRQEIKVPLLRLLNTLSQMLPQNCRIGVDKHAKLGQYCRHRHRCEYFAPVWGSLKVVILFRFGITSRSHLQGSSCPSRTCLDSRQPACTGCLLEQLTVTELI